MKYLLILIILLPTSVHAQHSNEQISNYDLGCYKTESYDRPYRLSNNYTVIEGEWRKSVDGDIFWKKFPKIYKGKRGKWMIREGSNVALFYPSKGENNDK